MDPWMESMRRQMGIGADNTALPTACTACMKEAATGTTFQRCGSCKAVFYCSKGCQTTDWPAHKATCKINSRKTVPINTESVPDYVQFGPVMTVGEFNVAGKLHWGEPKRQYQDRLYKPTPKEIYDPSNEILAKHDAKEKEKAKAKAKAKAKVDVDVDVDVAGKGAEA